MSIRGTNNLFGWGFIVIGVIRLVIIFFVILAVFSNLATIASGGTYSQTYSSSALTIVVGFVQILLGIGSIIMLIINIFKGPEVVSGYGKAFGAFILCIIGEFLLNDILCILVLIFASTVYIKSGKDIRENNFKYVKDVKKEKELSKQTGWFFEDEENIHNDPKKQKKITKLNEELDEWKQLLDLGEIDEQTFNDEKEEIIKKLKNLGANVNDAETVKKEDGKMEKQENITETNKNENEQKENEKTVAQIETNENKNEQKENEKTVAQIETNENKNEQEEKEETVAQTNTNENKKEELK